MELICGESWSSTSLLTAGSATLPGGSVTYPQALSVSLCVSVCVYLCFCPWEKQLDVRLYRDDMLAGP